MTEALLLIQTKLYRPPIEADLVPRPRLLDRPDANWQNRTLTLIPAPTSCGKSVLASMRLDSCGWTCSWVSLNNRDIVVAAEGGIDAAYTDAAAALLAAALIDEANAEAFVSLLAGLWVEEDDDDI